MTSDTQLISFETPHSMSLVEPFHNGLAVDPALDSEVVAVEPGYDPRAYRARTLSKCFHLMLVPRPRSLLASSRALTSLTHV